MSNRSEAVTVLIAEDDPEDRMLVREAWEESQMVNELRFVQDGEELLEYLNRSGPYASPAEAPRPGLILLDLNMPKKDGRDALNEIKSDPRLRQIPIIVLTSSKAEEDIVRTYDLGVNSYITKPVTFDQLVETLKTLGKYWIEIVELPA